MEVQLILVPRPVVSMGSLRGEYLPPSSRRYAAAVAVTSAVISNVIGQELCVCMCVYISISFFDHLYTRICDVNY